MESDRVTRLLGGVSDHKWGGTDSFHVQDRVYSIGTEAKTITTAETKSPWYLEAERIGMKIKPVGYIEKGTGKHQSNVVYDSNGLSPTICAGMGVKQQPTMTVEIKALDEQNMTVRDETFGTLTTDGSSPKHNNRVMEICAMRGRYGSDGIEQHLEVNGEGIANTLTTVTKDNLLLTTEAAKLESFRTEQNRTEQNRTAA